MPKSHTSFRLSEEALTLLRRLKEKHGISEASALEMSIRRMASADLTDDGGWPPAATIDLAVALVERGKRSR